VTKDKQKTKAIKILEVCIDRVVIDAAVAFPQSRDPLDIMEWALLLKQMLMEIIKRKDIPFQPHYKDLSTDEKVAKILELANAKVKEIRDKAARKTQADAYLNMETTGPPPIKPDQKEGSNAKNDDDPSDDSGELQREPKPDGADTGDARGVTPEQKPDSTN
jgi:hypothetical protein